MQGKHHITEEAVILEVGPRMVTVKMSKHAHCESCGGCQGEDAGTRRIPIRFLPEAEKGRHVIIKTDASGRLKASLLFFFVPTVAFVAAIAMASTLGLPESPTAQVLSGGVAMALSICVIWLIGPKMDNAVRVEMTKGERGMDDRTPVDNDSFDPA